MRYDKYLNSSSLHVLSNKITMKKGITKTFMLVTTNNNWNGKREQFIVTDIEREMTVISQGKMKLFYP